MTAYRIVLWFMSGVYPHLSSKVVGLLPMAGSGTRLNLPIPKPLVPTMSRSGVKPLYWHSYRRLRHITNDVRFVLTTLAMSDPCFDDLPGEIIEKPYKGELPTSVGHVAKDLHPDTLLAVALPDSIWYPRDGFLLLLDYLEDHPWMDGAFALFEGDSRILDEVVKDGATGLVKSVYAHEPADAAPRTVSGWGAFIARAGALKTLSDARPIGPQLGERNFGALLLGGPFYDLGTPERYAAHFAIDL